MTSGAGYIKIVEWSDEDRCFIGHCPGIMGPCCHGDDEVGVYRELCEIVDEWLDIARRENGTPPPPMTSRNTSELLMPI